MMKRNRDEERAALEVLRQTGINILDAALIAREALECGRGRPKRARKCIELGCLALRQNEKTVTFRKAIEAAIQERASRRPRSINDFRYLSKRLITRCSDLLQRRVRSITPQECTDYIRKAFDTPRQRNKARLTMSAIFSTSIKYGWCGDNPIRFVPAERLIERKISILSKEEIKRLLAAAESYEGGICLAAVGIMLYAGVRPHELERLPWSQIHLEAGIIHIYPQHSKTGGARSVTIHPPLAAILQKIDRLGIKKSVKVCPPAWRKHWAELHRIAGWVGEKKWVEDSLRHTYASQHLAAFRSYTELQLEMGHRSSELLRTRYIAQEGLNPHDNFWEAPESDRHPQKQEKEL